MSWVMRWISICLGGGIGWGAWGGGNENGRGVGGGGAADR